jgi:signal transduction histidine kinase
MSVQAQSRETELEALRLQLQRLQAELSAERSRGELKDEFLAVVAHELRAPLGAILGWAHMLRRDLGPEEMAKGLDVIEQSVQVQAKLIEDLLVMTRMASNKIRLDVQPVDLPAVIDAAVESVRPAAAEKGIKLRKLLDLPAPPIRGDATRVQQVLSNLLTNAVKFTPGGGEVEVSLKRSRGWAVIDVRDTGVGIAPAFLPHVFDRFRQGPAATRAHGGLGLGLAIARHLVELHGGEIDGHSEGEGRGATFTVRLPLAGSR